MNEDFEQELYENDLQTFSDNEAWADAQADRRDYDRELDAEALREYAVERWEAYERVYLHRLMNHERSISVFAAMFEDGTRNEADLYNAGR